MSIWYSHNILITVLSDFRLYLVKCTNWNKILYPAFECFNGQHKFIAQILWLLKILRHEMKMNYNFHHSVLFLSIHIKFVKTVYEITLIFLSIENEILHLLLFIQRRGCRRNKTKKREEFLSEFIDGRKYTEN